MECYQEEQERLYRILHTRAPEIAFVCMSPLFSKSISDELFTHQEPGFKMEQLLGISIIEDETVQGCFELILKGKHG